MMLVGRSMCWPDQLISDIARHLAVTLVKIPAGLYPGIYLRDVGEALVARDGKRYLDQPEIEWIA